MRLPALRKKEESLHVMTTDDLLEKAQEYGRVRLYQADSGDFSFKIEFKTLANIELKAESGFNHKTIKSAIIKSIENAEEIRKQFK